MIYLPDSDINLINLGAYPFREMRKVYAGVDA